MQPRKYRRNLADKGLPHDWEVEKSVLGGLLVAPELLSEVRSAVGPGDFHRPAHAALFELLCDLADRGGPPPDLTVALAEVDRRDIAERVGGIAYVVALPAACAHPPSAPAYARRVAEDAARRRLVLEARRIEADTLEGRDVGADLDRLGIPRADRASVLPWLSGGDWIAAEPPERAYLLHDAPSEHDRHRFGSDALGRGMLPRGKVGILAAPGGVGKTYALCGLALSVATGAPWLGWFPVSPHVSGRVALVLGEEDAGEIQRRLRAQAEVMRIDVQREALHLRGVHALPGAGLSLALVETDPLTRRSSPTERARELLAYLEREADRAGLGWDAVILDPLSRFAGADAETDNAAATRLVEQLERFAKLPGGPTVIAAHHVRKRGDDTDTDPTLRKPTSSAGVRGSSALVDGARWVARMEPGPGPLVTFAVTKSNYGPLPEFGPDGLVLIRPPARSGGIRAAHPDERERYAPRPLRSSEETSRSGGKPRDTLG